MVAALLLSTFTIHGLQPGAQLFHENSVLVDGFTMEMQIMPH
ncbi:hypothetical protein [Roseobacter ponti]|nr:hypothetical protein [Roseobacter ponti]